MATSIIKALFDADIHKVWEVVTSVEDYSWRSDLSRTEVISESEFIEYTTDGYPTRFLITNVEPYQRWEFDMDNGNMEGHWIGVFTQKGDQTEIEFREDVTVKKMIMKPFVKAFLKKQQTLFVKDLHKTLSEK